MKNQILTLLLILLIPVIAVSQEEEKSRYNYFKIIETEMVDSQSDTFRYHEDEQNLGVVKFDGKNNTIDVSNSNSFIIKKDITDYLDESETSGNVLAYVVENMNTGAEQFMKVYAFKDETIMFHFFSMDDNQFFTVHVRPL